MLSGVALLVSPLWCHLVSGAGWCRSSRVACHRPVSVGCGAAIIRFVRDASGRHQTARPAPPYAALTHWSRRAIQAENDVWDGLKTQGG